MKKTSSVDAVTTRVLSEWLGITVQAVNKHGREGVLPRNEAGCYDLKASVHAYCAHIREVAAGRGGAQQLNLTAERARLAREQADSYELKNAVTRGELVEVAEAERAWSDTLRTVRSCMLAVPSRVRQRLGHLTVADIEAVDFEVRNALTEAAGDGDAT
jgi:phage terminase Nu1 subunit (DNA packaging protein)